MDRYKKTENGILTVGALKKLIENLDDSTHVILGVDSPSEWANVGEVAIHEFSLTLMSADTFDSRQF